MPHPSRLTPHAKDLLPVKTWTYLWNHPLQRRVSLLTTIAVALAVVVFSLVGYLAAAVDARAGLAGDRPQHRGRPRGPGRRGTSRTTGALSADLRQAGGVVVEAVDARGQVLRPPGEQPDLVVDAGGPRVAAPGGATLERTGASTDGRAVRRRGRAAAGHRPRAAGRAVAGPGPRDPRRAAASILIAISAAGVLAAGVVGVAGRAAPGLRPMRQLTEAVEHVTATQDLQPVSVRYARGDLAILAASFNLMLVSLTRTRKRQSRLVADAGHELRTPLTSLRTNVDLLAVDLRRGRPHGRGEGRGPGGPAGPARRAERHDRRPRARGPRRLRAGARAARRPRRRRGARSSASVAGRRARPSTSSSTRSSSWRNADSLGRAVTNLLDNAVKWSPPGGTDPGAARGQPAAGLRRRARASPTPTCRTSSTASSAGESARQTKGTGLGPGHRGQDDGRDGRHASRPAARAEGGAEFTLQLPGVTTREAVSSLLVPSPASPARVVTHQPVSSRELTMTAQPAVRTRATAAARAAADQGQGEVGGGAEGQPDPFGLGLGHGREVGDQGRRGAGRAEQRHHDVLRPAEPSRAEQHLRRRARPRTRAAATRRPARRRGSPRRSRSTAGRTRSAGSSGRGAGPAPRTS